MHSTWGARGIKRELKCPLTDSSVEAAFGEEVQLFMHCHLRGYDKMGEGKQLDSGYYDKYGAPVRKENSWLEGYHAVERLLAKFFNICDNDIMDFPRVAGMAGGVHLYQPIHDRPGHSDQPWNWTGWIPTQRKWLSEGTFFSNRYFLAIRGNEIQNNLWDYHPFDEEEGEETEDMEYSQLEPNDAYRGGYFFQGNSFGRYMHVISLRGHKADPETGLVKRYNYIVHPLAYRDSLNNIPDNGVDAMQWSIINIAKESHFEASTWGEKCNGLEIFNDFTYSYSYAPESADTCYNGALIADSSYRYWFNTYPLEYAEFLLDSALARGVYLHTLTANDAFYQKPVTYEPEKGEDPEEHQEKMCNTISDPKGHIMQKRLKDTQGASREQPMTKVEQNMDRKHEGKAKLKEVKDFLRQRPYGFETVFGFTTLIDTEKKLRNVIFDRNIPGTGLEEAGCYAMDYLREGNFYSSTGISDLFDYSSKEDECLSSIIEDLVAPKEMCDTYCSNDQFIPYIIKNQPNPKRMCDQIVATMSLVFTFEKVKEKNACLIWRYTIMTETNENTLETVHGYFKLSSWEKTVLDLSTSHDKKSVKWLYFVAIHPENPMKRAWFNAIRGPAFGEPRVDEFELPDLQHRVFSTKIEGGRVVQDQEMQPLECDSENLDFMFPNCPTEKEDICVYFMQACPLQQDITIEGLTDQSSTTRPPRILQSVNGLFLMHPDHPTRLKLSNSWDKNTVKDHKVCFYEVNVSHGAPQKVSPQPAPYDEQADDDCKRGYV